jgi:hypothetical protein
MPRCAPRACARWDWRRGEDFQDRRVLGGVTFVDPFRAENELLLAEILPLH